MAIFKPYKAFNYFIQQKMKTRILILCGPSRHKHACLDIFCIQFKKRLEQIG